MNFKLKMPHTYLLLLIIVCLAAFMTYIIPAGEFERQKVEDRTEVINGSYHHVTQSPVAPIEIFRSIPNGLIEGGEIIFYIFIVGGAFGIIHRTDAITTGVNALMERVGRHGRWLIPITMIMFSILGFSIGLSEETIIFVPIGIALATALGYDAMVGAAMIALGAGIGFLGGMINPFMGIVVGIIGGLGVNGTFDALLEGMKDILFGAMIVGFAKAIVVVLTSGKIIDTIVFHMTDFIDHLPAAFSVVAMFLTQLILNFFIPSGSGQAMTTMPIMVPISDLLGINRQVAVMAFQYGDAISNNIIPTSASLMGLLAVAGIPYNKWLKFVWRISAIWVLICLGGLILYMYL